MARSRAEGEDFFAFSDADRDQFARLMPAGTPGPAAQGRSGRSTVSVRPALRHTAEDEAQFVRLAPGAGRSLPPPRSVLQPVRQAELGAKHRAEHLRPSPPRRSVQPAETAAAPERMAPTDETGDDVMRQGSERFSKPMKIRRPGMGVIKLRYFD